MNKRLAYIVACGALATPFAASAAGGYVGAGVGYASIETEEIFDNGIRLEDDRRTWQVYGGFRFAPFIGLEANYVDFDEASDSGAVFSSDGFGLALAGYLPITDAFTLSARVGQLWWDADASANLGDLDFSFDDSGNDTFYGVDARFGGNEGLAFVVRYDRFDVGETDIEMPSLNVQWGF
ncbi:MAG TPA: outer membrane beta-barrel protein [Gammaproteobacteria bacterium]|nr:outer membrane beta-barrel protein [Gammaproteobacteria bacterium]